MAYGLAYAYIYSSEPVFNIKSTILIKDDASGSGSTLLNEINSFTPKKRLSNEMAMIKSYSVIEKTLKQLNFRVSYFHEGKVRVTEIYPTSPFQVVIDSLQHPLQNVPIYIHALNDEEFVLKIGKKEIQEKFAFGRKILKDNLSFTILKNGPFPSEKFSLYFIVSDPIALIYRYKNKLGINTTGKESTILDLTAQGPNIQKEADFLNKVAEVYTNVTLDEKNQIATNTIKFIEEQLVQISTSLKTAENEIESFQSNNISTSGTSSDAAEKLEKLDQERASLELNLKYYDYISTYINENKDFKEIVAPSAIGIGDPVLGALISQLIQLKSERNQLVITTSEKNPYLVNLDNKIRHTTESLLENLKNIIKGSNLMLKDLNQRISLTERLISKLPTKERTLLNLQRKFNLNDHIYNYLLEKRAEAGIAKASNLPDIKILEAATGYSAWMIAPQAKNIYILAVVAGLLLPFFYIFIKTITNNKVTSKAAISAYTNIPILGIIGHSVSKSNLVVSESPKSGIAEAFRSLRVNLGYLSSVKESKLISITSSISGEGKTFCSINLATIISLTGNKTILIGADMRKPKIFADFGHANDKGLSTYLAGKHELNEVVKKTTVENLDFITAGPVPPNPAELMELPRLNTLIAELKLTYDFIIIDTPPVGLVSDAFSLMRQSDINVYIVRHKYTEIKLLEKINNIYNEGKIKNVGIVINDLVSGDAKYSYGYEYGYGYYQGYGYYEEEAMSKTSRLKNILRKFTGV
jgi:capsular exopolysaccharide synthesis family protein